MPRNPEPSADPSDHDAPAAHHAKYCRTCHRPLTRWSSPQGFDQHLHSADLRGEDIGHRPDPAPLTEAPQLLLECDFCTSHDPVWVYVCADQHTDLRVVRSRTVSAHDYRDRHHAARTQRADTAPGPQLRYNPRWSACGPCAEFIEQRDLYGLISRVTDALPRTYTRGRRLAGTRARLHASYSLLFDTLLPGRARVTPEHPLGLWSPPDRDPPTGA
jgi:hypothetical protein